MKETTLFTKNILPSAIPEPRYPVEISNSISNALQDAMYSEKDINEIAKLAEDEINILVKTAKHFSTNVTITLLVKYTKNNSCFLCIFLGF